MLGVIRHDGGCLSLRQICQRYDAVVYHDTMMATTIVAGLYNANGGLTEDGVERAAMATDFHPEHSRDEKTGELDQGDLMSGLISSAVSALGMVDV